MIVSIGLALAAVNFLQWWIGGRPFGLTTSVETKHDFGTFAMSNTTIYSLIISSVCLLGVGYFLQRTRLGRATRALPKSVLGHEPLTFSCKPSWAGENLARHYGTPQQMFDAWMASSGHRANILRPEFTSIGIGCVAYSKSNLQRFATRTSDIGGYLCSQVFLG